MILVLLSLKNLKVFLGFLCQESRAGSNTYVFHCLTEVRVQLSLIVHLFLLQEDWGSWLRTGETSTLFNLGSVQLYDTHHQLSLLWSFEFFTLGKITSPFPPLSSTQHLPFHSGPLPLFLGRWSCLPLPGEKKLAGPPTSLPPRQLTGGDACLLSGADPSWWLQASPKICHQLLSLNFL